MLMFSSPSLPRMMYPLSRKLDVTFDCISTRLGGYSSWPFTLLLHTHGQKMTYVCIYNVYIYTYTHIHIYTYIHTYITLHHITSHYITLHYIHTYIHIEYSIPQKDRKVNSSSIATSEAWTLLRIFPQELLKKIPQKLKAPGWVHKTGRFKHQQVGIHHEKYRK